MSAIKKIILLTAVLAVLIQPATAVSGVRYATVPVEKETFKRTTTLPGTILYLETQVIAISATEARLGEILVSPGDAVEAGDPVVTYTMPASATEQKQREVDLRAARDDYAYELSARATQIEEMTARQQAESDETQARILALEIERHLMTDETWRAETEATIAALETAYAASMAATAEKTLCAGITGVVDSIAQLESGARIAGKSLVVLRDPASALVRVDNSEGLLKYGMEADLRLSGNAKQLTTTSTVVACDNVLPSQLRAGYAYLTWDASESAAYTSATVNAVTMCVEDALVVSSHAISYKDGRYYVALFAADGTVHTRYVVKAMDTGSDAWICLGVSEGDKLITK